jgi:hypothetical protein
MERYPRLTLDYSMVLKGWELVELSQYREARGNDLSHVSTRFQVHFLALVLRGHRISYKRVSL